MTSKKIRIAIAGNPNSGKSTIFNALAGARQHVGNYPGVTVEKKEGKFSFQGRDIEIIDLPGTYSLAASSLDERIARNFIISEKPDVVVDVLDASNFERNAYLTAELLELGVKPVLVLNMSDRAKAQGQHLDLAMIEERLFCKVVETVGSRGIGMTELKKAMIDAAEGEAKYVEIDYGEELGALVAELEADVGKMDPAISKGHARWMAARLLEGDVDVRRWFERGFGEGALDVVEKADLMRVGVENHHGTTLDILMAERRYGFAAGLYREVLRKESSGQRYFSDSIDDILTHRFVGIPLFLAMMYFVFYITFTAAEYPMHLIEMGVGWLGDFIGSVWQGDGAVKSLVVDGMIAGVGGVLVFLPNILMLFLCISILEDTGYMARVAFIMDKVMHKLGLHGKSFIPMLLGFGCSVPAIMATRTLENRRDRLATMLAIPLMSCGARLPIYSLFIPAFFPPVWRPRVLWGIYMTGVLLAVGTIRLLRSSMLRGESVPFVMELPPYRMPTVKGIFIHMFERAKLYIKKAATIILAVSVVMWFLTSYPKVETSQLDVSAQSHVAQTFAGKIGKGLEPVLKPLGFDWRIGTALIGAMAAKEVFVSQMAIIFSLSDDEKGVFHLRRSLRENYSPLVGLCVLLFCLISFPCTATLIMTARESGRWRWALFQLSYLTALAYFVTLLVYQIGLYFGLGIF
jgi:ferrous iron transport protein B